MTGRSLSSDPEHFRRTHTGNGTGEPLAVYYRQPSKDEGTMRARVLFAGLVAISTVVIAGPASAKADIAEANITGPGLEGGLRIEAPDTEGLWESGIDVAGGSGRHSGRLGWLFLLPFGTPWLLPVAPLIRVRSMVQIHLGPLRKAAGHMGSGIVSRTSGRTPGQHKVSTRPGRSTRANRWQCCL